MNFKKKQCWIEPLIDYQERQERQESLQSGKQQSTITSIIVIEIDALSIDDYNINYNPLFNLLYILGFVTGTKVQSPWIEFRDEDYELIKHIHYDIILFPYAKKSY